MTKEELIMNIQQEWRCDDRRPAEQKRIATVELIDDWVASENFIKPDVTKSDCDHIDKKSGMICTRGRCHECNEIV